MTETGGNSQRVIFRGDFLPVIKQMYIVLPIMLALISLFTVGRFWWRMTIYLAVPCLFGVLLMWPIFRWLEWFYFDDQNQRVVMSFRRSIPYEKIKAVHLTQVAGWLSVFARTGRGRFGKAPLVQVLNAKEKRRLDEELSKRFSDKVVYQKPRKFSDWKALVPVMVLIMGIMYGAFFMWLDLYPWIQVIPQKKTWRSAEDMSQGEIRYDLGTVSFSVPEDFESIQKEKQFCVFRGKHKKSKLKVVLNSDIQVTERGLRRMLGLKDAQDVYEMIFYARFGLAPLMTKAHMLCHLYDVRIYEIEQDGLKGFMVRGMRRGIDIAEIKLVDRRKGQEVDFTLSSMEPIDDEVLGAIIRSVRRGRDGG